MVVPVLDVLVRSMVTKNGISLGNYRELFHSSVFWMALRNTTIFTVVSVIGHLIIGLGTALLVNQPLAGQRVWRNVVLLPWMLPPAVVGTTWAWLYQVPFGLVNPILVALHVIHAPVAWMSTATYALPAVIVANLWRGFPFISIILLAGLQAIPGYLHEAAAVDGARGLQQFLYVTLPNLRRVMAIAVTLDIIGTVKYFDLIWVMTQGGPAERTEVFSTLVYRFSFVFFRSGPATALAVVMFAALGVFTFLYIRQTARVDAYV